MTRRILAIIIAIGLAAARHRRRALPGAQRRPAGAGPHRGRGHGGDRGQTHPGRHHRGPGAHRQHGALRADAEGLGADGHPRHDRRRSGPSRWSPPTSRSGSSCWRRTSASRPRSPAVCRCRRARWRSRSQTGAPEQVAGYVRAGSQVAIFLTYGVVDKNGAKTQHRADPGAPARGSRCSRSARTRPTATQPVPQRFTDAHRRGRPGRGRATHRGSQPWHPLPGSAHRLVNVQSGPGVDNTDGGTGDLTAVQVTSERLKNDDPVRATPARRATVRRVCSAATCTPPAPASDLASMLVAEPGRDARGARPRGRARATRSRSRPSTG